MPTNHHNFSESLVSFNLILMAIGGGIDASQALVMSLAKRWRWESIWLVWAVFGCLIFPWATVFILLRDPAPLDILRQVPDGTIFNVTKYALGWGIGSILFGMAVVRVGMGLGLGISISLIAANGTLLPLVMTPEKRALLFSAAAINIYIALSLLIVGIVLCSIAAHRRPDEKPLLEREQTSFAAGILCCIACGFLSPLFNMAVEAGFPINKVAEALKANPLGAATIPVAITMSAGFITNAAYCVYLLFSNRSWNDFKLPGTASHWFYGALMGFLQMAGFLIYTMSASKLDQSYKLGGTVIGWPVYTASMILVGNIQGLLRGEWKGSDQKTFTLLAIGLVLLLVATSVVIISGATLGQSP
jgi:L-rhamnose-H+ transport protein